MNINYLRLCLRALTVLLWLPAVAWAGTLITVDGLVSVPLSLVVISSMLSTMSGATALLIRIDKELQAAPDKPLPRPWLFCAAHMGGSWMAGTLGFIVSRHQGMDVWLAMGLVIAASFLGAKFIELVAERYLSRVLPPPSPQEGHAP